MTSLEQLYKEKFEIGFPIFQRLFNLNKEDLLKVLKEHFKDIDYLYRLLDSKPYVVKTILNDEISEIIISYFDVIRISPFMIIYKPEHGSYEYVVKFDKFFNIEPAFEILNSK